MEHAELPWKKFKDNQIQNSTNDVIIWGSGFSKLKTGANAAFIVKACNSHESLLSALKDIMASSSGGIKKCGHEFTCVCSWDKAMEAIAQAEES